MAKAKKAAAAAATDAKSKRKRTATKEPEQEASSSNEKQEDQNTDSSNSSSIATPTTTTTRRGAARNAKKTKTDTPEKKSDVVMSDVASTDPAPASDSASPDTTGTTTTSTTDSKEETATTKKGAAKKGKKAVVAAPKTKQTKKKGKEEQEEEEAADEEEEAAVKTTALPAVNGLVLRTEVDFTKPAKGPNELKIVTWNVAGYRSIEKKGFSEYVKRENPDILCIQETKLQAGAIKNNIFQGYHQHFSAAVKAGYSGTAIFSKTQPIGITEGVGDKEHDDEGRVITAEFDSFYIVNSYIPNSGRGLKDLDYRKQWDKVFLNYLIELNKKKPLIWCGDLNVAHLDIDLTNPKTNRNKTAGFSDAERDGLSAVLKAGFVDSYRHLYPTKEKAYTYWSYFKNCREKNIGWRLDYYIISSALVPKLKDVYIRSEVLGSDHCPLVMHMEK